MADFYTINKEVLPLKANLIIQEAKLDGALAELAVAQVCIALLTSLAQVCSLLKL